MNFKRQDSIRQLRTQFLAVQPGSRPDRKIKRSFTENIRRDSVDSGLSSPTNYSVHSHPECGIRNGTRPHKLTRHLSLDNNSDCYQPDSHHVHVLHEDAETTLKLVDELVSTKTMRLRRTESASLSISERKRYATESVSSYTPVAPGESEWGQRFDEMIAKLKGIESSTAADEAHICDKNSCSSGCVLTDSVIDTNSEINNGSSVFDLESDKGSSNSINSIPEEEITPHKKVTRLFRSNTDSNTRKKSVTFDMKSLMRSLSFQRPDLATYNQPLPLLRRTDSDNDVWIEQPRPELKQSLNKPVAKTYKQHQQKGSTLKRSATWTKFSKIFVSSKTKA